MSKEEADAVTPEIKIEPADGGRVYSSSKYQLPDVNHSFKYQLTIINACVVSSDYGKRESNGDQVQSNLQTTSNSIRTGVSFLGSIGIINGDTGKFTPVKDTVDFYYAKQAGNEDEAKSILARIINKTWFADSAKQFIAVKNAVTEAELVIKLARDCQVDPAKRERSLKSLIEYLRYCGIILQQEDKKFKLGNPSHIESSSGPSESAKATAIQPTGADTNGAVAQLQELKSSIYHKEPYKVNFNFDISPTTDVEKVRMLIRAIKEELSEQNNDK